MTTASINNAAIAVNRFGLGARLNEAPPDNPKQWLLSQMEQYQANTPEWAGLGATPDILNEITAYNQSLRTADDITKMAIRTEFNKNAQNEFVDAVNARTLSALRSQTPFAERLVHFWANHFAVSADTPFISKVIGAYELEAIRPNIFGSFRDLLFAVEQHPAMLMFLDQARSIGPNSLAAMRQDARDPDKKHGLNENLAREILELHTLGVRSGYSQGDVTEFAKALTGWGIINRNIDKKATVFPSGFVYRPFVHEPGSRTLLGKTYAAGDLSQASQILEDLAIAPATAQHIAYKLAQHFVSDTPPPSLVEQLANTFIQEKGQLKAVYRVLMNASEAWNPAPAKFKSPWEWLISSLRGLGVQSLDRFKIVQIMNQLGQAIWKPGSPAGFDDVAAAWAAPDALLRRVEFAQRLGNQFGNQLDARIIVDQLLMNSTMPATKAGIARAESANTGLALMLVSPDFLRR